MTQQPRAGLADRSARDRRRIFRTLPIPAIVLLAAIAAIAAIAGTPAPAAAAGWLAGEIQIELASGVPIDAINADYETTVIDSLPPLYRLDLPDGGTEDEYLLLMRNDPRIVEVEYVWEGEAPEGSHQMVVAAVGETIEGYLDQNVAVRLHLDEIHEHARGDGVIVALVDGGVRMDHEALDGAIEPGGTDFVDGDDEPYDEANGIDDDGDGTVDEGAGHGTMVAGILHLVAPGAKILPIRVLNDEGVGQTFTVAKGVRYAVDHGARVINLSLGLPVDCSILRHEVERAESLGVALIGAAGNDGVDRPYYYPASNPECLSVAALDSSDVKASFSNFNEAVDVSAPGVGILSAYYDGGYAIGAGTSFAAPFVSGQCALIRGMSPDMPVEAVYRASREGIVDIYGIPENDPFLGLLGTGRFDALSTLENTPFAAGVGDSPFAWGGAALRVEPNPARAGETARIDWLAGEPANATAIVFDLAGRKVRAHLDRDARGGFSWDGRDERGSRVAPGVYFVRVESDAGRSTARMVRIRE
ncbi:MAG: S8 family serine peptidase [Candidatus Eisenbacteria bacterium]